MAFTHSYANIGTIVMYMSITVELTHHTLDIMVLLRCRAVFLNYAFIYWL